VTRGTVRDIWHAEVLRTSLVRDACRVLLLHMATGRDSQGRPLMTETGRIRVPRERHAADLDVNPKRITDRITEATRAGLLVKTGGGHNGQVSRYTAQLVERRKVPLGPAPTRGPASLATFVKVPAHGGPSESVEPVPSPAPAHSRDVRMVPAEPAPYVRARARVHYRTRGNEPAPDSSRGPEPHASPNGSSDENRATPATEVAADPWVPPARTRPAQRTA
jgi:hypothetical protein